MNLRLSFAALLILPSIAIAGIGSGEITTLYSKSTKQKIELSVVSEKDVNNIFDELRDRTDIPFAFEFGGSEARAHKMVRVMDAMGVTAGKVFLEGELYHDTIRYGIDEKTGRATEIDLEYQVSPLVMVRKGNAVIPYVLDPTLFKQPVQFQVMKDMFKANQKTKITHEYFASRFAYDPKDREKKIINYAPEALDDMDRKNKDFSRVLFMAKQKSKYGKAHSASDHGEDMGSLLLDDF